MRNAQLNALDTETCSLIKGENCEWNSLKRNYLKNNEVTDGTQPYIVQTKYKTTM